jgi:hypothetical protein
MVEMHSALAVMGNHEFNAVAWATPDGEGGFLRSHTPKNRAQHHAFLKQAGEGSDAHTEAVAWFKTLLFSSNSAASEWSTPAGTRSRRGPLRAALTARRGLLHAVCMRSMIAAARPFTPRKCC